jgi:Family of unknown function (DUF6459)
MTAPAPLPADDDATPTATSAVRRRYPAIAETTDVHGPASFPSGTPPAPRPTAAADRAPRSTPPPDNPPPDHPPADHGTRSATAPDQNPLPTTPAGREAHHPAPADHDSADHSQAGHGPPPIAPADDGPPAAPADRDPRAPARADQDVQPTAPDPRAAPRTDQNARPTESDPRAASGSDQDARPAAPDPRAAPGSDQNARPAGRDSPRSSPIAVSAAEVAGDVAVRGATGLEPGFDDEGVWRPRVIDRTSGRGLPARLVGAAGGAVQELPSARLWLDRLLVVVLECLEGWRPLVQLRGYASPLVLGALAARRSVTSRRPGVVPRVRSIHVTEPTPGIIEACAVVQRGVRVQAMAIRIEVLSNRWRCTALHVLD